jgi:Ca2+-transporting ATPase
MAIGTLGVFALAPGSPAEAGVASVAGTMGFNTFVLFQFFNILNVRNETRTVFSSETFSNTYLWASLGAVVLLQVLATHWGTAQTLFDTTDISLTQWLACIAVASSVLWVEEIHKQIVRIKTRLGSRNIDRGTHHV